MDSGAWTQRMRTELVRVGVLVESAWLSGAAAGGAPDEWSAAAEAEGEAEQEIQQREASHGKGLMVSGQR
jgi:hypothetical protein